MSASHHDDIIVHTHSTNETTTRFSLRSASIFLLLHPVKLKAFVGDALLDEVAFHPVRRLLVLANDTHCRPRAVPRRQFVAAWIGGERQQSPVTFGFEHEQPHGLRSFDRTGG